MKLWLHWLWKQNIHIHLFPLFRAIQSRTKYGLYPWISPNECNLIFSLHMHWNIHNQTFLICRLWLYVLYIIQDLVTLNSWMSICFNNRPLQGLNTYRKSQKKIKTQVFIANHILLLISNLRCKSLLYWCNLLKFCIEAIKSVQNDMMKNLEPKFWTDIPWCLEASMQPIRAQLMLQFTKA